MAQLVITHGSYFCQKGRPLRSLKGLLKRCFEIHNNKANIPKLVLHFFEAFIVSPASLPSPHRAYEHEQQFQAQYLPFSASHTGF